MKIEIKKIGNSTGVILPKELLARLHLKQGDWLFVTELPDGALMLAPAIRPSRRGWRSRAKPCANIRMHFASSRSDGAASRRSVLGENFGGAVLLDQQHVVRLELGALLHAW